MPTQRSSANQDDQAPVRIVTHRLQQTGGQGARAAKAPALAQSVSASGGNSDEAIDSHHRQVVLVDRDVDGLRDVAIALRDRFDFHVTISGNEALTLLQSGNIDAIVVGQTLYSSTGINVLAEARRRAPHVHRVLLASAAEAVDIERVAAPAAPLRLLQRPCTPQKLLELLESLESSSTSREASEAPSATPSPLQASAPLHSIAPHLSGEYEHVILETPPEPRRRSVRRPPPVGIAAENLPVVVYTDNAEFYHAICAALQDEHDVRLATQLENAVEMSEMGVCPILVTDRAATQTELQRISIALRAAEPALVTIASGTPSEGLALRKLLNTPALHAFLPKPLSMPLVRLTIESAKRHYIELKSPTESLTDQKAGTTIATSTLRTQPARPTMYQPAQFMERNLDFDERFNLRRWLPYVGAAILLLLAVAGGGWYWQQRNAQAQARTAVLIEAELELAQHAYDAGDYVTPDNANALYFYERVLKRDPKRPEALKGVDNVLERLVEQIERQLTEDKVDAAAQSVERLRELRPDHRRLAFLDNQVRKAMAYRQSQRLTEQAAQLTREENAKVAASNGRLLERRAADASGGLINNAAQRTQAVGRWLALARQRINQGRLLTPDGDNAEYYLRLAERADPNNAGVEQTLREIGARLLTEAQTAIAKQQLDAARKNLADAARFGANETEIARMQSAVAAAADAATRANFLRLALQRTRENALFEPAQDNAKYYLSQLQRLDASGAETQQALRALALRLIENANQATAQRQFNIAVRLLDETRRLGFTGSELNDADSRLRFARNPQPPQAPRENLVLAAPKVLKAVPAKFPDEAIAAGVSGWVDVEFKIGASGDVYDAIAVGSYPPGPYAAKFERAAINAISQYQYEPRNLGEKQVQRKIVRVQFKLQ